MSCQLRGVRGGRRDEKKTKKKKELQNQSLAKSYNIIRPMRFSFRAFYLV